MNPFLIFLILLGAILLWFLLTFCFRPIGKIIYRLWSETKETINNQEDE